MSNVWTPEMRQAAMKDAQNVCDLTEVIQRTITDLRLFSNSFDDGSASKDFCIGLENRLRSALLKAKGEDK